jgi:hypothetical protein
LPWFGSSSFRDADEQHRCHTAHPECFNGLSLREADNPSKTLLQPGEKATIEVRMNTTNFEKQRDTTLSIFIDAPQYAEVRIPISAYIRTDVVFDPGKVEFARIEYGTEPVAASRSIMPADRNGRFGKSK